MALVLLSPYISSVEKSYPSLDALALQAADNLWQTGTPTVTTNTLAQEEAHKALTVAGINIERNVDLRSIPVNVICRAHLTHKGQILK